MQCNLESTFSMCPMYPATIKESLFDILFLLLLSHFRPTLCSEQPKSYWFGCSLRKLICPGKAYPMQENIGAETKP